MPNEKFKSENYQNLGGIDSKTSQYLTSPLSFLNLVNFDFQTPGALTQRWGSTQYVGQTLPHKTTTLSEFSKLDGSSYVIFGCTGALYYGATTGQSPGMSFAAMGATFSATFQIFWSRSTASLAVAFPAGAFKSPVYYRDDSNVVFAAGNGYPYPYTDSSSVNGINRVDFTPFVDQEIGADGQKFFRFDGSSTWPMRSIPGLASQHSFVAPADGGPSTAVLGYFGSQTLGCHSFYVSTVNNRGYESPIWPVAFLDIVIGTSYGTGYSTGNLTATYGNGWADIYTPPAYGLSSINVYYFFSPTLLSQANGGLWENDYVLLSSYPVAGSTTRIALGTSNLAGIPDLISNVGPLPDPNTNQRDPLGVSFAIGSSYFLKEVSSVHALPFYPQFTESYQNRIFLAGFSGRASDVWFSDNGEPQGYRPDANFEVRTNDSDIITAIKAYQTKLYIFKKNSFFVLSGDNPENFFLQECSVLYGCVNNRSVLTYENLLIFLDRKGVMMFNGATLECLSNKIQPIFDRMNYEAAQTEACMVHDKLRNQVLIAIPVDGSTTNNMVLAYDYLAAAWTTHTGYNPSVFAAIQGRNNTKNVFFGDYQGRVNWQGSSFLQDNGSGYTLSIKSRFLHDMGESVEKQFRRFYLNADPVGTTLGLPIKFYQDYGTSVVYSTTFVLGAYQNRIDFGIPASSLAFEIFNINNSNSPLRIYGFTIESRMQRRVTVSG